MKTLILDQTKPPFTPNITTRQAAEWNLEERAAGMPHKAMALMFATLLEELYDNGILVPRNIGNILSMNVISVEELEQMPPFDGPISIAGIDEAMKRKRI